MRRYSGYLLTMLLLAGAACQQGPQYTVNPADIPAAMMECEGNNCLFVGGWRFNGQQGQAHWLQGAVANLNVERFDSGGIIIRRTDLTNSVSPGYAAVYTGAIHGSDISGTVSATWPGHWNKPVSLQWHAKVMSPQELQAQLQTLQQKAQGAPMTPEQRAQMEAGEKLLIIGLLGAAMSGGGGESDSSGSTPGVSNFDRMQQANHFYIDEHPNSGSVSGPYMR